MSNTNNASTGGLGVGGVLGIVFICAKLFGVQPVASWSWVWVTAPLWIGLAAVLAFVALFLIISLIAAVIADGLDAYQRRKNRKFREKLAKAQENLQARPSPFYVD